MQVAAPPILKEVGGIRLSILPSLHRLAPLPASDDSSPSQPGSSGNGALATGWPVLARARRTSRLARHAVAEVDDSRAEGAGPGEFEIHPALALGKERNATANQQRRTWRAGRDGLPDTARGRRSTRGLKRWLAPRSSRPPRRALSRAETYLGRHIARTARDIRARAGRPGISNRATLVRHAPNQTSMEQVHSEPMAGRTVLIT